jgi:hypothetical protein
MSERTTAQTYYLTTIAHSIQLTEISRLTNKIFLNRKCPIAVMTTAVNKRGALTYKIVKYKLLETTGIGIVAYLVYYLHVK